MSLSARHRPTPHVLAHVSSDTIVTYGPDTRLNLSHWYRVHEARVLHLLAPTPTPEVAQ